MVTDELDLGITSPLALSQVDVLRLTMRQRKLRLDDLIAESRGQWRRKWGWGADPANRGRRDSEPSAVGDLCSSCDGRFQATLDVGVTA